MRRPVLFAAAMGVVVVAGAAVPRLADLGNRPMHCDEAVHAIKFGRLLEEDDYVYDPREYHGPSLNFLALPIAHLSSAQKLTQISETHLRLLTAIFGIALVAMVWLIREELGYGATVCAALLTAVSPAMVFYSRYYVQEMLLVCFTFGAIVALWRYVREVDQTENPRSGRWSSIRRVLWLVTAGLCIGMMHASKETCVIALFAMGVAAAVVVTVPQLRRLSVRHLMLAAIGLIDRLKQCVLATVSLPWRLIVRHIMRAPISFLNRLRQFCTNRLVVAATIVTAVAAGVSMLFFSSFLDNPQGVIDSVTTYFVYLGRASGEGSVGRHVYPCDYYFRILFWWHQGDGFWWHQGDGPVWTEALIAALALVGLVAAAVGRGLKPTSVSMARFLAVYTVVMIAVYSAMPYKTPWCALGFLHGMILLAGIGAALLWRMAPGYIAKSVVVVLLVAAAGHLAWQAHRASFVDYEDRNNPYVYAHTTNDVPLLIERVEQIAAADPEGEAMHVQVICPDHDYWPIPWYLRSFSHVGWFARLPDGPAARLIITQPEMEPALVRKFYEEPPPGQRYLYVPLPPDGEKQEWLLRPHVPLRVFVRLDLWEAYQAGQD